MASLAGGAENTVTVNIMPSYAGNHTLQITSTSTVSDDNLGNDVRNQPFTVGYEYFNCDSSTAWTLEAVANFHRHLHLAGPKLPCWETVNPQITTTTPWLL